MKPMVLKDIAKELDLHESTISRITNSKEISTPRGIFQLKFFFSKAIEGMNGGENISSNVVKNKIKKLIDGEGEKPLSDSRLVSLLKDSGINLARRTVTKYRVTMRIPPSFERKKNRLGPGSFINDALDFLPAVYRVLPNHSRPRCICIHSSYFDSNGTFSTK